MKKLFSVFLLLAVGVVVSAAAPRPRPEIMGVALDMKRGEAQTRLQAVGKLERETRKRQEVWAVRDQRVSHLLVGYDAENRVRYVTAIARSDGPRLRYEDVASVRAAERAGNQGNLKFTWEVAARRGHFAYIMVARGHDPNYLDSYSVKKVGDEEEEID
jgi:hypothetical protein